MDALINQFLENGLNSISLQTLLSAVFIAAVCLLVIRIVTKLLDRLFERTHWDSQLRKILLIAIRFALYLAATLVVVDSLGIPITSLVALVSVLSLAVSLAAQTILSNVAGGLVLMSSKPFQLGDYIDCSVGSGTVVEIGLNHTKLDTPAGQRLVVPNSSLTASQILNYSTLPQRRMDHTIRVSYEVPTEQVRAAVLEAMAATPKILDKPAREVLVSSYQENCVEYTLRCWTSPADYWDVYYLLLENVKTGLEKHTIPMVYQQINIRMVEK